jgi:hypothetical protein
MRLAAALFALGSLVACGSEQTSRCNEVCDREARCVDELNEQTRKAESSAPPAPKLDSGECAAACKALDRDPEGKDLVAKHVECVRKASTCAAVVACGD